MSTLSTTTISDAFWFEDGNIVLIAANVAFKVHRGQLSRHSEVFEGLFDLPQPPQEVDDVYDGTPFVELHDSAQDVGYFLGALYDGLYVPLKSRFASPHLYVQVFYENLRFRLCLHLCCTSLVDEIPC